MSAAKHTPGPWTANFSRLNGKCYHWHVTGSKRGSMNAIAMADEEQGEPHSHSELEANAHLISAAPELLSALEFVNGRIGFSNADLFNEWKARVERVIAKARGEV